MVSAIDRLFQYGLSIVRTSDVDEFVPDDVGYSEYVRTLRRILATRRIPAEADFEITETISLTWWSEASRKSDPIRFRRFRVLTNAVAMAMTVAGTAHDDVLPPNYMIVSLIDDARSLQDERLWSLLPTAFEEFAEVLDRRRSGETAFALLGLLLVSARLGVSGQTLSTIADRLIDEESRCPDRVESRFLLRCTGYPTLHSLWLKNVEDLLQPSMPSLALIRDALLQVDPDST